MRRTLHLVAYGAFLFVSAAFLATIVVRQLGMAGDLNVVALVYGGFEAFLVGLIGGVTLPSFFQSHSDHAKRMIDMAEKLYLGMYQDTAVRPLRIHGLDGVGETHGTKETDLDRQLHNVLSHLSTLSDLKMRRLVGELRTAAKSFTRAFDEGHARIIAEMELGASSAFPGLEHDYYEARPYLRLDLLARIVRIIIQQQRENPRYEGPKFVLKRESLDSRQHLVVVHEGMPYWPLAEVPDPQGLIHSLEAFVLSAAANPAIIEATNSIRDARRVLSDKMDHFKEARDEAISRTKRNNDLGGWCKECPQL